MKATSLKLFFRIYIVSLVCVLLQTILKFVSINPVTGFYEGFMPVVWLIRVALITTISFWFFSTIKRKTRHDYALDYRHLPTSAFSILAGISILIYTISDMGAQVINLNMSPFRQKMVILLTFAFGILAGLSMIIGGIQPTYGRYGKPGAVLGLFPCLWQLLLLLTRFNYFIAITTISDVLFNILFMAFASLFLFGQSRIIYGLGVRNGRSYSFPSGLAMSLVGFLLVVPNIIYTIITGSPMISFSLKLPETIYILTMAIYAPVFLVGFSKSIHKV